MKLKTVEVNGNTYAEMKDGAILFTAEDGKELSYTEAVITRLSAEAMGYRKRTEAAEGKATAAEAKLKAFDGIDDPEAARKALEFQKNVNDGQYIAAGKAEEMKAGLTRTFEEKYAASTKANAQHVNELEEKLADVSGRYDQAVVGNAFANSPYIREKTAVPLKMLIATFAGQFKNEGGKVVARHANGEPIIASTGEPADFDESMQRIIEAFPEKDMILKGANQLGSGSRPGAGNGSGNPKSMSQSEFNKLAPKDRAARMAAGLTLTDA